MAMYKSIIELIERFAYSNGRRIGRFVIISVIFYLWAPIIVLTLMSFAAENTLSFPPSEWSLRWYRVFLNDEAAAQAVLTTLKVSIPVTVFSTIIGILIAYSIDRYDFPGKDRLQILATLPLVIPLVVGGVALVLFFGIANIDAGYWTIFIAHVIRTIPFATLIIVSTLSSFDRTLEEASMDLNANELQTFWKVTLPNIRQGVVAGSLLVFTMSFNEFVYTFFVQDTATTTLPVYIWGRIRFGVTPEINVISVLFLFVAVTLTLIAASLVRVDTITGRS